MIDLNPEAFEPLYRAAKLISQRKNGGIPIGTPGGTVAIDLTQALKDLDSAVRMAETCTCYGRKMRE